MGRGELQRIFKRIAVLFSNFTCKPQIILGITSVSQGLLSIDIIEDKEIVFLERDAFYSVTTGSEQNCSFLQMDKRS